MKNQKYINQLIEDLKQLQHVEPPFEKGILPDDFEEQMEVMEEAMLNNKGIKVSDFSGITMDMLPPADVLNKKQSASLTDHILDLLYHCNFIPEFPEGFPGDQAYSYIRECWDKFILPLYPYRTHYEFCNYDPEACPFPEYCSTCFENKDDPQKKADDIQIPGKKTILPGAVKITLDENDGYIHQQKERIKQLMKTKLQGEFIAGMHNYCNRWCSRCDKKQHCALNAMEEEMPVQGNLPPEIQSFVNMHASMMATKEILEEEDSSSMPDHLNDLAAVKLSREYVGTAGKIINMSFEYAENVHEWYKKLRKKFDYDDDTQDMMEIIMWYFMFIHAKLSRACINLDHYPEQVPVESDQNGSAKIALIGIKSSRDAWVRLMWLDCLFEEDGAAHVEMLNELEEAVRKIFPRADEFKRPGFD